MGNFGEAACADVLQGGFACLRRLGKSVRYDCRPGKHDILLEDWERHSAFVDEQFPSGS